MKLRGAAYAIPVLQYARWHARIFIRTRRHTQERAPRAREPVISGAEPVEIHRYHVVSVQHFHRFSDTSVEEDDFVHGERVAPEVHANVKLRVAVPVRNAKKRSAKRDRTQSSKEGDSQTIAL